MLKNILILIFSFYLFCAAANAEIKIIKVTGDVKVRYGVEEKWYPASSGMVLRDIDSILSGAKGNAKLLLENGRIFELSCDSYLDIIDLKPINQKELFLFIMSDKVRDIEQPKSENRIKISNVSVVHGDSKVNRDSVKTRNKNQNRTEQEINGALSLYFQKLFPNTVVKLKKLMSKYSVLNDKGKFYFYLAKSFEVLDMTGQAKENFKLAVDYYKDKDLLSAEEKNRLKEAQSILENKK